MPVAIAISTATKAMTSQGQAAARDEEERIAGDHDELAIGEVHQAEDAVDDDEAERHQRIGAAEAQHVDQELEGEGHRPQPPR